MSARVNMRALIIFLYEHYLHCTADIDALDVRPRLGTQAGGL